MSIPIGQPDRVFQQELEALQRHAQQLSAGMLGQGSPQWYRPATLADDKPFRRDGLTEQFRGIAQSRGQQGVTTDLEGILLQAEFLAVLQRSWRARHRTPAAALAIAAGRLRHRGTDQGVLRLGLQNYVEVVLSRGRS